MPEEPDDPPPEPPEATELMTPPSGGSSILPPSAAALREVIGDFEVQAKLGAGGMGAVYRARQVSLGRLVALKVLPGHMIEDAESVSRFQREARVAASLSHANLVRVFSAGEADGMHYIAMELIEGEDLGRRLKQGGKLPVPEALRICAEVARGLEYAWRTAHLIHRDIKPANIFLAADGAVKVGDLGLAKSVLGNTTGLTQSGTMMGTPHYISPEQARADKELDFRADIYSLGCTLYQMLTGQVPYAGTDPITIIRQHLDAPLPAILKVWPQCPLPLARLVGKMLKKSRHERHASYAELIAQIESVWAQLEPQRFATPEVPSDEREPEATELAASPTPATASAISPTKSKLPRYAAIAAAALVLVIGSVYFVFSTKEEPLTLAQRAMLQREAEAGARAAAATPAPEVTRGPAAIKLWTSAAELASTDPRKKWENGVISLDGTGATANGVQVRDGIMRGSIRANRDAQHSILQIRTGREGTADFNYSLQLDAARGEVRAQRLKAGKGDVLQKWPLPRPYGPEDWVRLELKAVGDQLTASVDGQVLGTVRDTTISQPGTVGVFAHAKGYFRDIEYVPLDGVATASAPVAAATDGPWVDGLAEWWAKHGSDPLGADPSFKREAGGSRMGTLTSAGVWEQRGGEIGDVAVRVTISAAEHWTIYLRAPGLGRVNRYYAVTRSEGGQIAHQDPDGKGTSLARFPLPAGFKMADRHTSEFRAQGDTLTFLLDGQEMAKVQDQRLKTGTAFVSASDGALIEKLEYRELPAAPAQPSLSASSEPWVDRMPDVLAAKYPSTRSEGGGRRFEKPTAITLAGAAADGAIRILYTHDPATPDTRIAIRRSGESAYNLIPGIRPAGADKIGLTISAKGTGGSSLGTFAFPAPPGPPAPGQPVELELRAVGSKLTAKVNGRVVGEAQDTTYAAGAFSANIAARTLLYAIQTLDLSRAAPAAASSEPWQDGLAEWWARYAKSGKGNVDPKYFAQEAGGSRVGVIASVKAWDLRGGEIADVAIRATFSEGTSWRLYLRAGSPRRYSVGITASTGSISFDPGGGSPAERLQDFRLPAGFVVADRHTGEFRAQGDTLSFLLDGQEMASVKDTRLTTGSGYVVASPGTLIEKLEYRELGGAVSTSPNPQVSPSSASAAKEAPFVNGLGMKFVPVPITGGPTGGQRVLFSVWDVRVRDYAAFATETQREWLKVDFAQEATHPAVNVSWEDATAFCAWLTERERKAGKLGAKEVYRLPSDHEWSCAVGIGELEDAGKLPSEKNQKLADVFPWGSAWPPPEQAGNYWSEELRPMLEAGNFPWIKGELPGRRDGFATTSPVGSFPANRYGLYDLGGNVWQWCEDWFDEKKKRRVLRGAAWNDFGRGTLRSSYRTHYAPGFRNDSGLGIRCVVGASAR